MFVIKWLVQNRNFDRVRELAVVDITVDCVGADLNFHQGMDQIRAIFSDHLLSGVCEETVQ